MYDLCNNVLRLNKISIITSTQETYVCHFASSVVNMMPDLWVIVVENIIKYRNNEFRELVFVGLL